MQQVLFFLLGAVVGAILAGIKGFKAVLAERRKTRKNFELFKTMNQYLTTKQVGRSIVDYLTQRGFYNVAIYGVSYIAERVIADLKGSPVKVLYGIDRRANEITFDLTIYPAQESYPPVDAVIVTTYEYDQVAEFLKGKVNGELICFEEMIYRL